MKAKGFGWPGSRVKMEGSSKGGGSADVVLQNYKLGKTLGIGSFGKVKIAEHLLTGHKVAIKILNRRKIKNMEMEEKVRREIKILRLFMHPHIIRLYEVIETHSDIYVVMEYVKSGELFDYIVEKGRLQEDEARRFFQQIISGVEYCHRNMVAHRDLKPENLLLDSKCNVKIADFGLSNVMRDGHFLKTSCGSPNYAAPEVISGKLYAGPEVDVWSCGVILYALLCGTLPFDDENIPNLFKKIKSGIYTLPSHLSALARDLIPRMLVVDPMKRITIREIREHPWFQMRLPRYLAVPPPDTMQQARKIDDDIIQEVIKMGFDKNQLVESLHSRISNEATVSYYLLLDNRFRAMSGYLGGDFQETMDYGVPPMSSSENSEFAHRLPGYMDPQGIGLRSQLPVERKWALGLQSRAHPREIMTEVLKALQELNVRWKRIGHYNMKCCYIPGFSDHAESMLNNSPHANHSFSDESAIVESDNIVKFEIQLYKTREEKYLLDLQRVSGSQLLFLDLCAAFLAQLRVL
ncbi:SNF1-related protein kinase catalytic subunit alpha KIN10-like isoform X1 [Musa acuminata AAA Group]